MNIVLLDSADAQGDVWQITSSRQIEHLKKQLDIKIGDSLKVGIKNGARYLAEILEIEDHKIVIRPLQQEAVPEKLPVTLVVAMPRPKVLRRLIQDSVTLGFEKIILLHSYRVDKSYWQTPFLQQLDQFVTLGLEQAGDTIAPQIEIYQRFKPFVEDILPQMISATHPAFVAHPYAQEAMPNAINQPCTILIGPEGGYIPYEIDLLIKNGCQAFSLGNRIIRTETVIPYLLGRLFSTG